METAWKSLTSSPIINGTSSPTLRHDGSEWKVQVSSMITNTGNKVGISEENPQGVLHISEEGDWQGGFTGSGLDDLAVDISGFSGSSPNSYAVRIINAYLDPNEIEISSDGGSTWTSTTASGILQFSNGVTAKFSNTTGHTYNDHGIDCQSRLLDDVLVIKAAMWALDKVLLQRN